MGQMMRRGSTMPRARLPAALAVTAGLGMLAAALVGRASQDPPADVQTPFRTGANVVRVDVTVIDRQGNPVTTLTADDFEVREDGRLQTITSFQLVHASGEPSDDRSLPIRSQHHARAEAARDDVRAFLIFWDEYHIEQFVGAIRGREALTRAVLEGFGPTDLVAIMDPLTPTSAIELTRDRRALADRISTLEGRRGLFVPPRSAIEEEHLRRVRRPEEAAIFRRQVVISAIRSAMAYLGTLREGRKTLILVTQGLAARVAAQRVIGSQWSYLEIPEGLPPGFFDDAAMGVDLVRAANDHNVAVHVIDPRGLQVARTSSGTVFEMLASGSGGAVHETNDAVAAVGRVVKQASATYLLGYERDTPANGRFHEIKVRLKRGGYDVRARSGYWAPRAGEMERAKEAAAAAVLPPAVADAFTVLPAEGSPRLVDVWAGVRPGADGGALTLAWTPRPARERSPAPSRVVAAVRAAGAVLAEGDVEPGGTSFVVPAGALDVVFRVIGSDGEELDRETRRLDMPGGRSTELLLSTPVVHRARTPAEVRAIATNGTRPPIHAGREFVRGDRLFVHIEAGGGDASAIVVSAGLLDRRGALLTGLPVARMPRDREYSVDLPLASLASGEYLLSIEAQHGAERAEQFVAFRVVR